MTENETRYFIFPVSLLEGFLVKTTECLNEISAYAIYVKCRSYEQDEGDFAWAANADTERVVSLAYSFFGVTSKNREQIYERGKELYDSIPNDYPKTSLNKDIFFDFFKNEKTEFDKVCLLAHLALKSIIQNKKHVKTNNKMLYGRMAGLRAGLPEDYQTPDNLDSYFTRRKRDRIIRELELNWNLKYYSYYTDGFFISYTMTIENLILLAEDKRQSNKVKKLLQDKKEAREKVMKKFGGKI